MSNIKRFACLAILALACSIIHAAKLDSIRNLSKLPSAAAEVTTENIKDRNVKLRFDTRMEGKYMSYINRDELPNGELKDKYGFEGRYIKLVLFGNITDKLSYSFRYRLNVHNVQSTINMFHNIDWLNLTYRFNNQFAIAGGKQMIYMGGWEYDAAPVDVHIFSKWWWNTPLCFGFGVNGSWTSPDKNHTLYLQATNSHMATMATPNMFSYGLTWYGNMKWFKTIYSINFIENEPGKFVNYIVLGNKFDFKKGYVYVDWMNRAGALDNKFFSSFSIIAKAQYEINDKFAIFAKGGWDQNLSQNINTPISQVYDRIIMPGTRYGYYGLGVEYTPLVTKKHALRLHALWTATTGHNGDIDPLDEYMPHTINIGIKWQMNVLE